MSRSCRTGKSHKFSQNLTERNFKSFSYISISQSEREKRNIQINFFLTLRKARFLWKAKRFEKEEVGLEKSGVQFRGCSVRTWCAEASQRKCTFRIVGGFSASRFIGRMHAKWQLYKKRGKRKKRKINCSLDERRRATEFLDCTSLSTRKVP